MVHACNLGTFAEAKASRAQGQPGLYSKTLPQKEKIH
jgi:hypothetical protein